MDLRLLEILACPVCKSSLSYQRDLSALDCVPCRLRFAINDDIPILLADEAQILSEGQDTHAAEITSKAD